MDGSTSDLPLLDASMRATPLQPSEWKRRLEEESRCDESPNGNSDRNLVLLDVRNGMWFSSLT